MAAMASETPKYDHPGLTPLSEADPDLYDLIEKEKVVWKTFVFAWSEPPVT